MAKTTFKGSGVITSADYHSVKFVGKTKAGAAVTVTLKNAINKENIDWTFAEKDDVIGTITFTGCYDNTDDMADSTEEPWEVELGDAVSAKASENIMLGAGYVEIDGTKIGLCRGGGHFTVEREIRNINADGDRGDVVGRHELVSAVPTLEINVLEVISNFESLYAGVTKTVTQ